MTIKIKLPSLVTDSDPENSGTNSSLCVQGATKKKEYSRPQLTCHGSVVDITHFGGSATVDSGSVSLGLT